MIKIKFIVIFLYSIFVVQAQNNFHQWISTPPMAWSYSKKEIIPDAEFEIKKSVDFIVDNNLQKSGWKYIIIANRWYVGNETSKPALVKYSIDKFGRLLPDQIQFPTATDSVNFKALSYYLHERGLKFGLKITSGIPVEAVKRKLPIENTRYKANQIYTKHKTSDDTYALSVNHPAVKAYYNSIFRLYASWGVDFIQIDGLLQPYKEKEIEIIRGAIDSCGRQIVLCLSSGNASIKNVQYLKNNVNVWSINTYNKEYESGNLFSVLAQWMPFVSTGTYPFVSDSDFSGFSEDEISSLVSFHYISKLPWLCEQDFSKLDKKEFNIFSSDYTRELLEYSRNNKQVELTTGYALWTAEDSRSSVKYIAIFNLSGEKSPQKISINLKKLGISESCKIIDIWKGKDLGIFSNEFTPQINYHGSGLYKIISDFHF